MPLSGGVCKARNGKWESYDYHEAPEVCAEERCNFSAADVPRLTRCHYPTLAQLARWEAEDAEAARLDPVLCA